MLSDSHKTCCLNLTLISAEIADWHAALKWLQQSAWLQTALDKAAMVPTMLDHSEQSCPHPNLSNCTMTFVAAHLPLCTSDACNSLSLLLFVLVCGSACSWSLLVTKQGLPRLAWLHQVMLFLYAAAFSCFCLAHMLGCLQSGLGCMVCQNAWLSHVVFAGDLAYLKVGDLAELGLPSAAHAVLVQCVEKGFCKPPIAVEVSKSLMELQTPIRVCGLGAACWSCTLFQLPWHVS